MRIVFLVNRTLRSGGLRVIVALSDALVMRGHCVTLLIRAGECLDGTYPTRARILSSARWALPRSGTFWNLLGYLLLGWRVPLCEIVVATYYPTVYSALLAKYLRRSTKRVVYLVQHRERLFCQGPLAGLKRLFADLTYRLPVELVVNSAWMLSQVHEVTRKRATVTGVGVDMSVFRLTKPLADRSRTLVLTVGRTQPIKGLDDFYEAMRVVAREVAGVECVVLSQENLCLPGDIFGQCVKPADDLELVGWLNEARVFVSTSWFESFGLPPLEAMACGTPVVTTDSGGIRDYARHEINCLVCPPRAPVLIAEQIVRLLRDPTLQRRLSAEGCRTAEAYSWDKVAERFEKALLPEATWP